MKKFVSIISFVLVAAMLCVSLVSCGGPAKTAEEAAAALKENGYTLITNTDAVVSATKGDEYITVTYCSDEAAATKIYDEAVEGLEEAQKALEDAKKELDEAQDKVDSLEDGLEKTVAEAALAVAQKAYDVAEKAASFKVGQSGNVVWAGTKQAIKDAK